MPRRRWLTNLAITAVTVGICLLLAEAAVRTFLHITPPLRVRNASIGEHYLPGFDQTSRVAESGRRIRLRFNRLGFRGPDWPEAKPAGVRRVAVLGDSMVAALAVEEAETMVAHLGARLTQTSSTPWEALNFGVSASSPGQAYVVYRERAAKFDPDLVVLAFFVGNDLSDSSRALDSYPRIYFELDDDGGLVEHGVGAGRSRSSSWLNRNSRFYVWQKRVVNHALATSRERADILPGGWWIFARDPSPEAQHAWRIVEAVFATMKAKVEADGRRFEIVVLPSGRQVYPDRFEQIVEFEGASSFRPEHADTRLARACKTAGVRCTFLREHFLEATDGKDAEAVEPDELLFFHGTGHFTPAGHALAAKVLATNLSD